MKSVLFLCVLLIPVCLLHAQDTTVVGEYQSVETPKFTFEVFRDHQKLMLQIVGQGSTELTPLSAMVFQPQHIRPAARIEFRKDSLGHVDRMEWTQKGGPYTWVRIGGATAGYTGMYQLVKNPYRILHVTGGKGLVTVYLAGNPETELIRKGADRFIWRGPWGPYDIHFNKGKDGRIADLTTTGTDHIRFAKVSAQLPQPSNRVNGFTHCDSLQGKLTALRSCYDVLFYDLAMTIEPETKSLHGSNMIRFRAMQDFDRLQVDLHANLNIDKILYHGVGLTYTRDCNAVFVDFPRVVRQGSVDSMTILYGGVPLEPEMLSLRGGIFWLTNRDNKMWIESVTQGIGANVMWPCKDHLSDRADSMRISVTIPSGLEEISNGQLLGRTELPGGQTRYVWYVHYPVPTYDIAINTGDYAHFSDVYAGKYDTFPLNFYCMRYNLDFARKFFSDTKRMLAFYENEFGPYPFPRDGYTVMESIWAMEHHGATSIGPMNVPFNSTSYDSAGSRETFWHESAHEWWGNSVGCSDYADMWINESFASYASEFLNNDAVMGRQKALQAIHDGSPTNQVAVIGVYDVNHFHMGDMYQKGELMLQTIRTIIDNDSLWFSILRGIQKRYRYQPIGTAEIVDYFNRATGEDYTYLFDQYLRYPGIPILAMDVQNEKDGLRVRYKWEANVNNFRMPVKITTNKGRLDWIYPTTSWQTMEIKDMRPEDLHVDTQNFYIGVKMSDSGEGH